MTVAFVAFVALNIALILINARTARAKEATVEHEREQWRDERRELLNRIKPETAQQVPNGQPPVSVPAVDINDDAGYWRAHGYEVD